MSSYTLLSSSVSAALLGILKKLGDSCVALGLVKLGVLWLFLALSRTHSTVLSRSVRGPYFKASVRQFSVYSHRTPGGGEVTEVETGLSHVSTGLGGRGRRAERGQLISKGLYDIVPQHAM